MNEIESMIRRARREERVRQETAPKNCFVIDHSFVEVFCDPDMADEYYRRTNRRVCFECYYWRPSDGGCQKPFGFKHLVSILKGFLWRLRWRFPPLDRLYIYHFKIMKRRLRDR